MAFIHGIWERGLKLTYILILTFIAKKYDWQYFMVALYNIKWQLREFESWISFSPFLNLNIWTALNLYHSHSILRSTVRLIGHNAFSCRCKILSAWSDLNYPIQLVLEVLKSSGRYFIPAGTARSGLHFRSLCVFSSAFSYPFNAFQKITDWWLRRPVIPWSSTCSPKKSSGL